MMIGVLDCAQVSPASDSITLDVMTLLGFSIMHFRQAFEYSDLNDLNTPIPRCCNM